MGVVEWEQLLRLQSWGLKRIRGTFEVGEHSRPHKWGPHTFLV